MLGGEGWWWDVAVFMEVEPDFETGVAEYEVPFRISSAYFV